MGGASNSSYGRVQPLGGMPNMGNPATPQNFMPPMPSGAPSGPQNFMPPAGPPSVPQNVGVANPQGGQAGPPSAPQNFLPPQQPMGDAPPPQQPAGPQNFVPPQQQPQDGQNRGNVSFGGAMQPPSPYGAIFGQLPPQAQQILQPVFQGMQSIPQVSSLFNPQPQGGQTPPPWQRFPWAQ